MPISFEGLEYTRHLFKPIPDSETGGCHADVYMPSKATLGPYPIALAIHGGAFCLGDTQHIFQGHTQYLLERGFCVVSVEYRLAPHALFQQQREDWLDSYRWVRTDLLSVVASPIDPTNVMVFGGSAGGTATLFLALDAETAGLPPPKTLYVVYPAVDWQGIGRGHVDYGELPKLLETLPKGQQRLVTEMLDGRVATAYDFKTEHLRPLTGRRVWFNLNDAYPFLIPCIMGQPGPAFDRNVCFLDNVTSSFPPTILIRAESDTLLDPQQTTDVYERLQELGVETKLLRVEGMLHGDAEGENDIMENPPRVKRFWNGVYDAALDWCIERTRGSRPLSQQGSGADRDEVPATNTAPRVNKIAA